MENENVTIVFRRAYTDEIDGELSLAEFKLAYPRKPLPGRRWQRVSGGLYSDGYFARLKMARDRKYILDHEGEIK